MAGNGSWLGGRHCLSVVFVVSAEKPCSVYEYLVLNEDIRLYLIHHKTLVSYPRYLVVGGIFSEGSLQAS